MRRVSSVLAGLVIPCILQAQSPDSTKRTAAQFTAAYTATLVNNVAGGVERGSLVQHAVLVDGTFDLHRLVGWRGAHFFLSLLGTNGQSPDQLVGDLQGVLSTTAPSGLRLEEAWLEQDMLHNRLSLLAGRYDVNFEFYRLQSTGEFFNASFGIGPELSLAGILGPPTYPFTSLGARFAYKPTHNSVIRVGLFDGVPVDRPSGGIHPFARGDGAFAIAELALLSRPDSSGLVHDPRFLIGRGPPRPYASKLAVGVWEFTTNLPDLADTTAGGTPVMHSRSGGAYLITDGVVWRARDSTTTLALFAQLGISDPDVTIIDRYVGGGLAVIGPFKRRPDDQLGLAVASARVSSHYRRAQSAEGVPTSSPETTLELTYLANVASWLGVHADLQYVIRPGGKLSLGNSLVPSLQLGLSHTF